MIDHPSITVIVPCRNEELFISDCLNSLLLNDYPSDKVEVLVIDGMSDDKTPKILDEFINVKNCIRVITNPMITFPSAVNLGIKNAKGEFIFIAGAHARYPVNYISSCISNSYKYNADNIGGVMETLPMDKSITGKLISMALSSPFGVGNSKFRVGSSSVMETDTVFGGCYRKEVFLKHGLFNENLTSTSDYEFNRRIKKAGARILLVPEIKVSYYTRTSFRKFIKNNIRNGFWSTFPIFVTDHFPVSLRHLVPLVFILALMLSGTLSLFSGFFLFVFLAIIISYLFICLIFSLQAICNVAEFIIMPVIFFSLHISYGTGSLTGILAGAKKKIVGN